MVLGFAVAIYRLIFEWDNNKNDLLSVLVVNPGGLAIYGGVLGGVVVALIYRKEKPYLFTIMIAISAMSNFYFFYMLVFTTIIYVIVRFIFCYGKNVKMWSKGILSLAVSSVTGLCMAAIVFLPVLHVFLSDSRFNTPNKMGLVYPFSYYAKLPGFFIVVTGLALIGLILAGGLASFLALAGFWSVSLWRLGRSVRCALCRRRRGLPALPCGPCIGFGCAVTCRRSLYNLRYSRFGAVYVNIGLGLMVRFGRGSRFSFRLIIRIGYRRFFFRLTGSGKDSLVVLIIPSDMYG